MAKAAVSRNKAYLVYIAGGSEHESYLLLDAKPATFMGVRCVSGMYRTPGSSYHWLADRIMHIPLERILHIVEYDSLADYRDAVKRHYQERAK